MKQKEQILNFEKGKTFFGLQIYKHGVKKGDIEKLPFYEYWEASSVGSTCAVHERETYVYIHDWQRFCSSFVAYGTHRFQG